MSLKGRVAPYTQLLLGENLLHLKVYIRFLCVCEKCGARNHPENSNLLDYNLHCLRSIITKIGLGTPPPANETTHRTPSF